MKFNITIKCNIIPRDETECLLIDEVNC